MQVCDICGNTERTAVGNVLAFYVRHGYKCHNHSTMTTSVAER